MSHRRPILAACLILVVFATGGLGIAGGRVICIGAQGHVAVAGAHDGPEHHDCCHESDSVAADHDQPCALASDSNCTDWSLDAQHAQRSADEPDVSRFGDFAPIAPHLSTGGQLCNAPAFGPCCLPEAGSARIPRAHLAPLASVLLLI